MLKSGLTYEQVQDIITSGAVDSIENARGGLRKNGNKIQVYFNYQKPDPTKPTGKRQVRVCRQTSIDAKELNKPTYSTTEKGKQGRQRTILINAFRNDILADVKSIRGVQSDPTATVGAVCESFIRYKLEMGETTGEVGHGRGIRSTTAFSMKNQLKRLKKYPLYDMQLADVTPTMVQEVINDMCKTHSGSSVIGTISVLRQASRWCLGARADLPTDNVVLPSVRRKAGGKKTSEEESATVSGRKNILRAAKFPEVIDMCSKMTGSLRSTGIAAILGLTCGLRVGEVAALQWKNVHLEADKPYVHVCHSLNSIMDEDGHYIYTVGKTKSRSSVRNVAIPEAVVPIIRRMRVETLEDLLALDVPEGECKTSAPELFVCGDLLGNFRSNNAVSSSWRTYCKRHGIHGTNDEPLTFHQLRDSFASALIDDGVPVLRVSHMLGHETIDITIRRYVFGNDKDAFESIEEHGNIFGGDGDRADRTDDDERIPAL